MSLNFYRQKIHRRIKNMINVLKVLCAAFILVIQSRIIENSDKKNTENVKQYTNLFKGSTLYNLGVVF